MLEPRLLDETEGRDFVLEGNVLDDELIDATNTCQSGDIKSWTGSG